MDVKIERVESLRGGNGHVIFKHILGKEEMSGRCRIYAELTLEPTCSIGYHIHNGESETYYMLSGEGIYDDNGTSRPVHAGDVTFTPNGRGHGIANTGSENLIFMALIILD